MSTFYGADGVFWGVWVVAVGLSAETKRLQGLYPVDTARLIIMLRQPALFHIEGQSFETSETFMAELNSPREAASTTASVSDSFFIPSSTRSTQSAPSSAPSFVLPARTPAARSSTSPESFALRRSSSWRCIPTRPRLVLDPDAHVYRLQGIALTDINLNRTCCCEEKSNCGMFQRAHWRASVSDQGRSTTTL
jgi:hypothetical protein